MSAQDTVLFTLNALLAGVNFMMPFWFNKVAVIVCIAACISIVVIPVPR